jgi:EpsI family protein
MAVVAALMLAGTWAFLARASHGEPVVTRRPLGSFPMTLAGRWRGQAEELGKRELELLRLSDYLLRVYTLESARPAPTAPSQISLYVGYYQSQRSGATYHSPQNCLPGAGWSMTQVGPMAVPAPGGGTASVKRAVIEKGLERQLILYWYQDRGRIIDSEYWAKAYLIWDAATKDRTDGALVRITVPVVGSLESAEEHALAFLRDAWPVLGEHLPGSVLAP